MDCSGPGVCPLDSAVCARKPSNASARLLRYMSAMRSRTRPSSIAGLPATLVRRARLQDVLIAG